MAASRGVAVITGAGRGIGAATAIRLARAGHDVGIGFLSDDRSAAIVAERCRECGVRAITVAADVADAAAVAALFSRVETALGRPEVLVNNAGMVAPKLRLEEIQPQRIERMLAVNVAGAFHCAREAVLRMSTRHGGAGGVIVNVSSIAARLGGAGEYVDYAASKAAIDTMTRGLALEVAGEGIRVVCIRPGLVNTEIHASGGRPGRFAELGPTTPMRRGAEPDEIAAAIAWACSDDASYVTGAVIDVGGGR